MSKIQKIVALAWALLLSITLVAQTTREELYETVEKTAGVYYAYPEVHEVYTSPPVGYEPFYISHYGRHGSRWLISENDYLYPLNALKAAGEAGVLTETGKDVLRRLELVWANAEGMLGQLSPLGARQHREIAGRMYKNFPQVFANGEYINARSTTVVRCVLSMAYFCGKLKELNPSLDIAMDAGERYVSYLNYRDEPSKEFTANGDWRKVYNQFRDEHLRPERLMKLLFTNADYVQKNTEPKELMYKLYWVASNMQNVELDFSLYDIFEKDELFDMSLIHDFSFYVAYGPSPLGRSITQNSLKPLLRNILDSADEVLKSGATTATLRFGHDSSFAPLTSILDLENCVNQETDPAKFYLAWSNFKVSPMAANVQIVFFRKKDSNDILVKFLHNEKEVTIPVKTDVAPYYHWSDVEQYYRKKLES